MSAATPVAKALTSGKWEVTDARLSNDRRTIFLTTSEVHPGERQFYTMSVDGGARTRITTATGSNEATVSPDEKTLAVIYSYSTKPPELQVMPFAAGATAVPVTVTPSDEFRAFKWIDPKVITYKARDGADVYARLFTPEMIGAKRDPKKPAVIFVHGAGYLQEAHKYWSSSYYRENMFNNILASKGYVVLSPDYRASARATAATGAPRSTGTWAARTSTTSSTARSSWCRPRRWTRSASASTAAATAGSSR